MPTWICAERAQRDYVLDHLSELVVKPVDGLHGRGVLIGPEATDAALEAIVLAVHLLNVRRVLVVPHTRCAMTRFSENELRERISELSGQDAWWQHFHVVPDQHAALVEDVHRVTSHPLVRDRAQVGGFLYDVDTGLLDQLV